MRNELSARGRVTNLQVCGPQVQKSAEEETFSRRMKTMNQHEDGVVH